MPARLQGPQRPRRAGARRAIAHPPARRRDRPRGHPGRGRAGCGAATALREALPHRRDRAPRRSRACSACSSRSRTSARPTRSSRSSSPRSPRSGSGALLRRSVPRPVARAPRLVRRARRGLAHPAAPRRRERDRARGRVRRRRRARRARRAPAPPVGDRRPRSPRSSSSRVAGSRDVVLGLAVGAVFVAAVVSRFGRFGMPRTHRAAHARARQHARRRGERAHRLLRREHRRRHLVRRRRRARAARRRTRSRSRSTTGPTSARRPTIMKILDDAQREGHRSSSSARRSTRRRRSCATSSPTVSSSATTRTTTTTGAGSTRRYPELERTQQAFAREIGTCPVWFRPPHGQRTPLMARVVKDHGMRMAMWDVARRATAATTIPHAIATKVLDSVQGGSIIDLHAGLDGTSAAHRAAVVAALPVDPRRAARPAPAAGPPRPARRRTRVPALRQTPAADPRARARRRPRRTRHRRRSRARRSPSRSSSRRGSSCSRSTCGTRSCCRPTASTTTCTSGTSPTTSGITAGLPWHMPVLAHGDAYAYPVRVRELDDRRARLAARSATGRSRCGPRSARSAASSPPSSRSPSCGAAGGPRPCSPTPRSSKRCCSGSSRSRGARCCCCSASRAWRRGHRAWAAILVGLGQANHAAIVLPIGVLLVAATCPFVDRDRARAPALVRAVVRDRAPRGVARVRVADDRAEHDRREISATSSSRSGRASSSSGCPIVCVLLQRTGIRALAPVGVALALDRAASRFEIPLNVGQQWSALVHNGADTATLDAYLRSPAFVPGATYRVLRGGDGKLGLYHVLRAGGRLDSELFPESMAIRSFDDVADYAAVLCERRRRPDHPLRHLRRGPAHERGRR